MSGSDAELWLLLYGFFYTAVVLYWARIAAVENRNVETFFSAGHALSPWISALSLAGASLAAYLVLGGSEDIARHGLTSPALLEAGVAIALPGTLLFKRLWFVCQRLRLSSQAELFRAYYESDFLVVVSVLVAVIFAVGFAGLELRALSHLTADLSGGIVSPLIAGTVISFVLAGYVIIGGMRAVGYLGAIQAVLIAAATAALAGYALLSVGGLAALNTQLAALAKSHADLFSLSGVIRFTAGFGRTDDTLGPSALTSLGIACAFMGFQLSPLATKIVLSTRGATGFGAGQTWVTAAAFGGLIVVGVALIGAVGLIHPEMTVSGMLTGLGQHSPWFMAWGYIGFIAGVQLFAGLALLTAGEALVRHLYKPYFHASLSRRATVNITRIVIALLALISLLMQALTPISLSALAAVALPISFQLATPLLGCTWLRWITRPAAVTGVGFGIAGVILTEPLGLEILSWLGLQLPWGRWPWTLPSVLWGGAANLAATLLISAITNRTIFSAEATEIRAFLSSQLGPKRRGRNASGLTSFAWSAVLIWLFFALGPGLVFGNFAFGVPGTARPWVTGMPSIWAWSALCWALGVGLIWFLAYRMEMADPVHIDIDAYEPPPRLKRDTRATEAARLKAVLITAGVLFAIVTVLVLSFGAR